MIQYYKHWGEQIIRNGYEILPNYKGQSYCRLLNWNTDDLDMNYYNEKIRERRHNHSGIGLRCTYTPMVDIDVDDYEIAEKLQEWCFENIGYTGVRVGNAPRRALLYKTDTPFKSVLSNKYNCSLDYVHALEVKSNRMHMAMYNLHSDTGRLYEWVNEINPYDTPREDLPTITPEHCNELVKYFESITPADWVKKPSGNLYKKSDLLDKNMSVEEAIIANAVPPVDMTPWKLQRHLNRIDFCDYYTWWNVGCALHHQFHGNKQGFTMWDEWCAKFPDVHNFYENQGVWENELKTTITDSRPVTARYIISTANKVIAEKKLADNADEFVPMDVDYTDTSEIDDMFEDIDGVDLGELTDSDDYKITVTTNPSTPEKYKRMSPDEVTYSNFLNNYVFVQDGNGVYDLTKPPHLAFSRLDEFRNYSANMRHKVPSPTKSDPDKTENQPIHVSWMIDPDRKTAQSTTYFPKGRKVIKGEGDLFFVNTFYTTEHDPIVTREGGDGYVAFDKSRIEVFLSEMKRILPIKEEREWFVKWIAFTVQRPEVRCKVTPMLVTRKFGTGRGWIVQVMENLIGKHNVKRCTMETLMGKGKAGGFHDYMHQSLVTVVDEIALKGADKFEAHDAIRESMTENRKALNLKYDTNRTADVFCNFFFIGNNWDGIAIPIDDRRTNIFSCTEVVPHESHFDEVYEWAENKVNIAHLYYYLQVIDLDDFNWKTCWTTEGKRRMVGLTTSSTEVALTDFLNDTKWHVAYEDQIIERLVYGSNLFSSTDDINEGQARKLLSMRTAKASVQSSFSYRGKTIRTRKVYLLSAEARTKHSDAKYLKEQLTFTENDLRMTEDVFSDDKK